MTPGEFQQWAAVVALACVLGARTVVAIRALWRSPGGEGQTQSRAAVKVKTAAAAVQERDSLATGTQ